MNELAVLDITFSAIFSYEDGLTMEKHSKKTSVPGYPYK
jgi:hypothetical protein